jgi:hypothetical protein
VLFTDNTYPKGNISEEIEMQKPPEGNRKRVPTPRPRWHSIRRRDRAHLLTDMGVPILNDGSVERADIEGRNRRMIVPDGGTFTPRQWCIRRA